MMMNFMYAYTKFIKEAGTHKLGRPLNRGESTKELAKSTKLRCACVEGKVR